MIIDLIVTIDYNDGEPADCFTFRRIVSFEIGKIYNHAIRNKIPLNSIEELSDTLTNSAKKLRQKSLMT